MLHGTRPRLSAALQPLAGVTGVSPQAQSRQAKLLGGTELRRRRRRLQGALTTNLQ